MDIRYYTYMPLLQAACKSENSMPAPVHNWTCSVFERSGVLWLPAIRDRMSWLAGLASAWRQQRLLCLPQCGCAVAGSFPPRTPAHLHTHALPSHLPALDGSKQCKQNVLYATTFVYCTYEGLLPHLHVYVTHIQQFFIR